MGFSLTRDRCRTPMQWNTESNAGFTPNPEIKTWLKIPDNYKKINVVNEENNPGSLLNCYKRLIRLRRENVALHEGLFDFIKITKLNKNCIAYKRIHDKQETHIYLNFSKNELILKASKPNLKLIFSTISSRTKLNENTKSGYIKLNPLEGIILE